MAFNYYICIVLIWQPFQVKAKARDATTFLSVTRESRRFRWPFYFFGFLLVFILLPRFYHTALLARLFMRKVAQSTCKIKIIISSCWATAIICVPCAVHITQPEHNEGGRGRKRESWKKCKCSETLCVSFVSVCVSVVALLSMLHVVQLSWHNLIKGKRSWKSAQNYLSSAAVVKDFSLTFNYLSREGPLFLSFSHSYCLSHSRSIVCFKYLYSRYTYHR